MIVSPYQISCLLKNVYLKCRYIFLINWYFLKKIKEATRKGLRKVNKTKLIPPVSVVKLALTFLSMLCWRTPPHSYSSYHLVATFL